MSLTVGPGPFGPHNSGAFNPDTGAPGGHTLYRRGSPQRVRATFNGETVVDRDSNGRTHTYAATEILEVPTDLSVTAPLGGDVVSLQACIEDFRDCWTERPNWNVRYVVPAQRVA